MHLQESFHLWVSMKLLYLKADSQRCHITERYFSTAKKTVKKISLLGLVPISPRSSQQVQFKRGHGALPALAQSCMPPRGAPGSRHHHEPRRAAHPCKHSNSTLCNCDQWSVPEHFPNKYASAIAIHTSLQAASSFRLATCGYLTIWHSNKNASSL